MQTPKQTFNEVMWRETAILFGFYWLFRWLVPGLLPESLREATFTHVLYASAFGGVVIAGLKYLAAAARGPKS